MEEQSGLEAPRNVVVINSVYLGAGRSLQLAPHINEIDLGPELYGLVTLYRVRARSDRNTTAASGTNPRDRIPEIW